MSATSSINIHANFESVMAYVVDPMNLPNWTEIVRVEKVNGAEFKVEFKSLFSSVKRKLNVSNISPNSFSFVVSGVPASTISFNLNKISDTETLVEVNLTYGSKKQLEANLLRLESLLKQAASPQNSDSTDLSLEEQEKLKFLKSNY